MILFTDDEKREMDSYLMELEMSFPDVIFKDTVDEALKVIGENRDKLKLLILDIMMPPGNEFKDSPDKGLRTGVHFYESVRRILPDLPVVIFTNVNDAGVRERFEGDFRCWFLKKEDYLPYELAEEIREILT